MSLLDENMPLNYILNLMKNPINRLAHEKLIDYEKCCIDWIKRNNFNNLLKCSGWIEFTLAQFRGYSFKYFPKTAVVSTFLVRVQLIEYETLRCFENATTSLDCNLNWMGFLKDLICIIGLVCLNKLIQRVICYQSTSII